MMKKLLFTFVMAFSLSCPAFAGDTTPATVSDNAPERIELKNGEFYDGTTRIKPRQMKSILPEDLLDTYKKGYNQYSAGYVMSYAGGFLVGSGLASLLYSLISGNNDPRYKETCLYVTLAGVPLMIASFPLAKNGDAKLHAVESGYNKSSASSSTAYISFGTTPSGIGLALNF